MAVQNGQKVNASVTNAAFMSRLQDSDTVGKQDFKNSDSASGDNVINAQREWNGQASFTGRTLNGPKNETPNWNDNSLGSSNDNLKERADALTTRVSDNLTLINQSPTWEVFSFTNSDLADASQSNTITIVSVASKTEIERVIIKHSQSFTGGNLTAYTMKVGISGNLDKYMRAFDVFQSPGDDVKSIQSFVDVDSFSSSTDILLTAESTNDTLDAATQGSVEIWILKSLLP